MSQTPSIPWQEGDAERRRLSDAKIRYVNNLLTPLAVVIVVPGLIVAPLPLIAAIVGWVLITRFPWGTGCFCPFHLAQCGIVRQKAAPSVPYPHPDFPLQKEKDTLEGVI